MKYTLLKGTHGRKTGHEGAGPWKRFVAGDFIELTEDEAKQFPPGVIAEGEVEIEPEAAQDDRKFTAVLDGNVTAVRAVVDGIKDPAELALLIAEENAGAARAGVVKYAQARIEALKEG